MFRFQCACGKSLKVGVEHLGRRVKCPACGEVTRIPADLVPVAASAPARQKAPQSAGAPPPAVPPSANDFEFDPLFDETASPASGASPTSPPAFASAGRHQPFKPPARPVQQKVVRKSVPRSSRQSTTDWGTAGVGVLMMAGAVAWFVIGFFAMNVIFFYPPILFVLGLIQFARGMMS